MAMRSVSTRACAAAAVVLLLGAGTASAHHNMVAQYALDKPVTIRGTVSKVEWKNPHGAIYLDVKGADGRIESWLVETGSVGNMRKRGLKPEDFHPGTELVVGGWPAKDGERSVAGWIVTFPDRETARAGAETSFSLGR